MELSATQALAAKKAAEARAQYKQQLAANQARIQNSLANRKSLMELHDTDIAVNKATQAALQKFAGAVGVSSGSSSKSLLFKIVVFEVQRLITHPCCVLIPPPLNHRRHPHTDDGQHHFVDPRHLAERAGEQWGRILRRAGAGAPRPAFLVTLFLFPAGLVDLISNTN